MSIDRLINGLPTDWVETYVRTFEAGRVQKHPQARFVNGKGECCVVAALTGVGSASEFARTPAWASFCGGPLEELSRRFESRRLTPQQFYEEALLSLVSRAAVEQLVPA